jgi:hypothetical protein
MFSLKALWTECNPHKAPQRDASTCYANRIHHAEANSFSDVEMATHLHQGEARLQSYWLDHLHAPQSVTLDATDGKGTRLLTLTKVRAITQLQKLLRRA